MSRLESAGSDDTIAAIATALGGGVGIIRVSGPDAISLAQRLFDARDPAWLLTPRRLAFGHFVAPVAAPEKKSEVLDEGLAVVFPAPHSLTGEDVVEFQLHGGALHLHRCLGVVLAGGARIAEPGEFTRRAFLNGRIDLTRAEAVAALVSAETDLALAQARTQLQGALYERMLDVRERLLTLRAHLEVNLDFPDEDIPPADLAWLQAESVAIGTDLGRLAATFRGGRFLKGGARVALAGSPNVGKSSLFNALVARDRAIVTSIPGTTRDTLEEMLDLGGIPVTLIDTAGLRETADEVERLGIARTETAVAEADLVLYLVGPGEAPPEALPARALLVASKADLGNNPPEGAVAISVAGDGRGLDALRAMMVERLGRGGAHEDGGGLIIVQARQHEALVQASEAAMRAGTLLAEGAPPDLAAVDLHEAMDAIAALVGQTDMEDVLDRLFAGFCIGK